MAEIKIYTDGSSRGNPGPGGYGVILLWNHHRKEIAKGFRLTTNNRMELLGVIAALEQMPGYLNLTHKTFACTKCSGIQ